LAKVSSGRPVGILSWKTFANIGRRRNGLDRKPALRASQLRNYTDPMRRSKRVDRLLIASASNAKLSEWFRGAEH
jgi:hypothetical protein